MGADINGDGLMYNRNENGENSGVESSNNTTSNSNMENGGSEDDE